METNTPNNNPEDIDQPRLVVLLLLEGWGVAPDSEVNAIFQADTTNFLDLVKEYPVAVLDPGKEDINSRYLELGNGLSDFISKKELKQIKVADSNRFAPDTYYFNNKQEGKLIGEEQIIISADQEAPHKEVIKETIKAIKSEEYQFILSSISDIDDIAGKGDLEAVKKVIEAIDDSLKKIVSEVLAKKGVVLISASSGHAEKTKDLALDVVNKDITNSPVPLVIVGEEFKDSNIGLTDAPSNDLSALPVSGTLKDVVPTILKAMKMDKPGEMMGKSFIE